MDNIWTIIATVVTTIAFVCSAIGIVYVKMVKTPHDIEEQYNRKLQEQKDSHTIETLDFIKNEFSQSIKKFEATTTALSKNLQEIAKSRERFEVRLDNCEEKLEIHDRQIDELRHYHMESKQ